jgi:predicted nuclease of predicted toxin-antitoxin system
VRVLLDESLPRPFAAMLSRHDVRTVAAMGWSGKQNGELLQLAADNFDVLLTADRNLEHQQNLTNLPISVVVLVAPTNRIESLRGLVPEVLEVLKALPPRRLVLERTRIEIDNEVQVSWRVASCVRAIATSLRCCVPWWAK